MKKGFGFLIVGLLSLNLFAQDDGGDNQGTDPKIKLSGFGYYMFGQAKSGIYGDGWENTTTTFKNLWQNISLIHLNVESNATDWFTAKLALELVMKFPVQGSNAMDKSSYFISHKAYLREASGIMHWDFDHTVFSSLKIKTGLVPYTINPEVKTLGNYLFRSTVHPLYVQNKIDDPLSDILGGIAEVGFFENKLKFEAMLCSEYQFVPFFDFTPAFGLYYKPNEVIDIGGAIAFHHALQANCAVMADSVGERWQGTKLNFRGIFDPKPLFGGMDFLGKDQLKIYAELAILGLDNVLELDTSNIASLNRDTSTAPIVFPEISLLNRMPLTIGLNFPSWKIFDILALELEWFYSPYANDWFGAFADSKAEARQPTKKNQYDNYLNKDNFKWSLYMKKAFGKFEARGIFGTDHTIYIQNNVSNGNFEQTLKRPDDWHWYIQLRYNL